MYLKDIYLVALLPSLLWEEETVVISHKPTMDLVLASSLYSFGTVAFLHIICKTQQSKEELKGTKACQKIPIAPTPQKGWRLCQSKSVLEKHVSLLSEICLIFGFSVPPLTCWNQNSWGKNQSFVHCQAHRTMLMPTPCGIIVLGYISWNLITRDKCKVTQI